jgi:hypothetical protein
MTSLIRSADFEQCETPPQFSQFHPECDKSQRTAGLEQTKVEPRVAQDGRNVENSPNVLRNARFVQ